MEERKNLQTPDLTFTYESKIYIEGPKTKFTHFDEYDKALLHQFGSIIKIVKCLSEQNEADQKNK